MQAQINTAVAQTIEAQRQIDNSVALTVAAQNAAVPSATPLPSPTETPIAFPTLTAIVQTVTPFAVNPPAVGGGNSGGNSPQQPREACDVIRVRPFAYAEIHRGQKFDIKMTIENQGTKAWYQGYDVKYVGGTQMSAVTRVELPAMAPGDRYEIVLDAVAPDTYGVHTMTWAVQGRICFGYITITVN